MVGRLMIRNLNFFPGNELVSASRTTGRVLEEIYMSSDQFNPPTFLSTPPNHLHDDQQQI